MRKLRRGEYLGAALRRREFFGLPLTITSYPAGGAYSWHVHELPTLFVLVAGQHRDENRRVTFQQSPLSVVFHPTIGPHTTAIGPDGLIGVNLELTDAWLDRWQLRQRDLAVDYRLLDSPWAQMLGLRLITAAYGLGETANADAETAALELVAALVGERAQPNAPWWLPRAQEFLRAHAGTTIRLSDVAAEVGIHPVYCARAFRRATGCTVSMYVQILRLLDAGSLILSKGRSLAAAALSAGFADQAHFTRTCSRLLGCTPGSLRRMRQALRAEAAGSSRSRND
jgi:AraC family transcriptional regulator